MPTAQLMPVNPANKIYLFDDFLANMATNGTGGNLGWNMLSSGTGSGPLMLIPPDTNHFGILDIQTGTTATGKSALLLANSISSNSMKPYQGSYRMGFLVQVPVLSNGTDRFQLRIGFGDTNTADFANGIYFEYDDSVSSNWRLKTANASVRTVVDSGIAVPTATWQLLEIFSSDASVSHSFAINGTTVGTISSNIPTSDVSPFFALIKSLGTTARHVYFDYFVLSYNLKGARY